MKKYRLKREAIQFFDDKYKRAVQDAYLWHEAGVSENAIEEVEEVYLSYGIKRDNYSNLGGWSNLENKDSGSHFCFTINFPCQDYREYKEFSETVIPVLMRDIQAVINKNYEQFNSPEQ